MAVTLSPKQQRSIREAVSRVNLWHGAVSSGKTLASLICWLDYVANGPPGNLLMVGKTKETIARNALDPLASELLPDHPQAVIHTMGSNVARILGRKVYVVGANDKKAETRIRGITLAGAYVDEASLLPAGYWPMLETRLRVPGARLFATTNPDSPNHWLKRDVLNRADELGVRHWHFVLRDNPGLDEAYIAYLETSLVGLFRRRFLLGEWVAAEGAIYDMLDLDEVHRVPRWPEWTGRWWLGIDHGAVNPLHAVLLGLGGGGVLYVAGEWVWDSRARRRQKTDLEYSRALRDWLDGGAGVCNSKNEPLRDICPERVAPDPSAAPFRQQLRRDGYTGLVLPDNSVLDGIRIVGSLLGTRRLKFVEGCAPVLEGQMSAYVWDDEKQEKGLDEPLKVDDHGPDGLRYGVQSARGVWRHWLRDVGDPAVSDTAA